MQHIIDVILAISKFSTTRKPDFNFFQPNPFFGTSAYIDGGNACIIATPWYCVHLIRGAYCVLKSTNLSFFKKWEFFVLAKQEHDKSHLTFFGAPEFFQMPLVVDAPCSETGNVVRDNFEQALITQTAKLEVSFLVKDGLLGKAISSPIIALAKTTGQADLAIAQQPDIWWTKNGEGSFCRLHSQASTIFRFEISGDLKLLEHLAFLSRDLVFPGYPYGLILVDRLARISNNEQNHLLCLFEGVAGSAWSKINAGIRLLESHKVLDTIS